MVNDDFVPKEGNFTSFLASRNNGREFRTRSKNVHRVSTVIKIMAISINMFIFLFFLQKSICLQT